MQPQTTPKGVLVGVENDDAQTAKRLDRSGEEKVVPKPGFEPGHPCGR